VAHSAHTRCAPTHLGSKRLAVPLEERRDETHDESTSGSLSAGERVAVLLGLEESGVGERLQECYEGVHLVPGEIQSSGGSVRAAKAGI
jgi:hypothetical protein